MSNIQNFVFYFFKMTYKTMIGKYKDKITYGKQVYILIDQLQASMPSFYLGNIKSFGTYEIILIKTLLSMLKMYLEQTDRQTDKDYRKTYIGKYEY